MPLSEEQDALVSRIVEVLKARGRAREVAILTAGTLSLAPSDNFPGDYMEMNLKICLRLHYYEQVRLERNNCEAAITNIARELPVPMGGIWICRTDIEMEVAPQSEWRKLALSWLQGEGVNNQGRVRSDNMPSREVDGLYFRSQPEVLLYKAFKARGVVFAPLPVFLRGGKEYQRIEPDFIVVQGKALMLVEVDGDTVHMETPAEADARTRMFKLEGAYIERVKASQCDTPERAEAAAAHLLDGFAKWRGR
jgi:hypothetical protein